MVMTALLLLPLWAWVYAASSGFQNGTPRHSGDLGRCVEDARDLAARTGTKPESAREAVALLADPQASARACAAWTLGELGIDDGAVIPALKKAIADPEESVRMNSVWALQKLGSADPSILETLISALDDASALVRSAAAGALGRMGRIEAVGALDRRLKDGEPTVAIAAALALSKIERSAPMGLEDILKDINDSAHGTHIRAVFRLSRLGVPGVPDLLRAARSKDPDLRMAATRAMGELSCCSKESVPALVEALKDSERRVRLYAVYALGRIGPPARAAIPALRKAQDDPEPGVRGGARTALQEIEAGKK